MGLLATVVVSLLLSGAPVKVTVSAPGHTPKINVHWNYSVTVTENGKPVEAKLTEQIIDPLGGHHPVEFGTSTKNITNWPFHGTYRDFIIWPADSRGVPLTFHVIVAVGKTKKIVDYSVTPTG